MEGFMTALAGAYATERATIEEVMQICQSGSVDASTACSSPGLGEPMMS